MIHPPGAEAALPSAATALQRLMCSARTVIGGGVPPDYEEQEAIRVCQCWCVAGTQKDNCLLKNGENEVE